MNYEEDMVADIEERDVQQADAWALEHARWVVGYLADRTWRLQVKSGWLLTVSLALSSFLVFRFRVAGEKELLVLALFSSAVAVILFIVSLVTWRISSPASGFVEWSNKQEHKMEDLLHTLTYPQKGQRRSVIITIDNELEVRSNLFKYGVVALLSGLVLVAAHLVAEGF